MKNKIIWLILASCIAGSSVLGFVDNDRVSLGGTYLGVFNTFDTNQAQFDFATNLDIAINLSDTISGIVQFQGGNGGGSLGFAGPEVAVTDVSISQVLKTHNVQLTYGSFDTPFGYETHYLTNNADTFSQSFLLNHLLYSAFAGPVGTLNTLGIKLETYTKHVDITASVSNGTGETAVNANATFETLLQVSNATLIDGFRLTGTVMNSDDRADSSLQDNTSFEAHLMATLLEARYTFKPSHYMNVFVSNLDYGDSNSNTKDRVSAYGIEYSVPKGKLQLGFRSSWWVPEDHDQNNSGMSAVLPLPGLGVSVQRDSMIRRLQLSLSYTLNHRTRYIAEYIQDTYDDADSVTGLITGINIHF